MVDHQNLVVVGRAEFCILVAVDAEICPDRVAIADAIPPVAKGEAVHRHPAAHDGDEPPARLEPQERLFNMPCAKRSAVRGKPRCVPALRTTNSSANSRAVRNPWAYIRSIRAISGQGGHNATYRAACTLRRAGLSPEEALAALVEWNKTNAEPPWSVRELLWKVQSAFKAQRGTNSP